MNRSWASTIRTILLETVFLSAVFGEVFFVGDFAASSISFLH